MPKINQITDFNIQTAINVAKVVAGDDYTSDLETVLKVALQQGDRLPNFRVKDTDTISIQDYTNRWVTAYLKGFKNRPSLRQGNKSNTYSDSIIKYILSTLFSLDEAMSNKVEAGHSIMMTIENIVGELLEEYLSIKLSGAGWCCCWGSTMDAVDFCKSDGSIMQIKNSDNSENSSSMRVRENTKILKWHRRNSKKEESYNWAELIKITGIESLSENNFREFVKDVVKNNPDCIYIEGTHPLKTKD